MARRSKAVKSSLGTHVVLRDLGRRSRLAASPFDNLRRLGLDPLVNRRVIYDPAKRSVSIFSDGRHSPSTAKLLKSKSLRQKYLISRCHNVTEAQRRFGSGGGAYRRRKPRPLKKAAIVLQSMQRRRC